MTHTPEHCLSSQPVLLLQWVCRKKAEGTEQSTKLCGRAEAGWAMAIPAAFVRLAGEQSRGLQCWISNGYGSGRKRKKAAALF